MLIKTLFLTIALLSTQLLLCSAEARPNGSKVDLEKPKSNIKWTQQIAQRAIRFSHFYMRCSNNPNTICLFTCERSVIGVSCSERDIAKDGVYDELQKKQQTENLKAIYWFMNNGNYLKCKYCKNTSAFLQRFDPEEIRIETRIAKYKPDWFAILFDM